MQWIGIFMKGFNSILTGFSWGMGFSVAIILSGLVYTKFVEPSLGNILEDKEIYDKAIEYFWCCEFVFYGVVCSKWVH